MALIKKELKKVIANTPCKINYNFASTHAYNTIQYIVSASTINISKQNILCVAFYSYENKALLFQVFSDHRSFVSYHYDKKKWTNALINNVLIQGYYRPEVYIAYDSFNSMTCAGRYFHSIQCTYSALSDFENNVHQKALDRKHEVKRKELEKVMGKIKAVPKFNIRWINQVLFKEKQYMFFKRQGKSYAGYCTYCQHDVTIKEKPVHNQKGKCPHCHQDVKYKAIGLSKSIFDEERFDYIQKNSDGIITRSYCVSKDLRKDKRNPEYRFNEFGRTVNFYDGRIKNYIPNNTVYTSYYGDWKYGSFANHSYYYYHDWMDYRLTYPVDFNKLLKNTPWQYSAVEQYINGDKDDYVTVARYLDAYYKYPVLEYLVKFKMFHLSEAIVYDAHNVKKENLINLNGKNIKEVFNGLNIKQIVSLDMSEKELMAVKKIGCNVTDEQVLWLRKYIVTDNSYNSDLDDLLKLLKYMKLSKLITYIESQHSFNSQIGIPMLINHFADYYEQAKDLNYNFNRKDVLFPKSVENAHNGIIDQTENAKPQLTAKRQLKQLTPEIELKYASQYSKAQQYEYANRNYAVIASKSARDLINEGMVLNHCVGGYVSRVANGSTTILYVRNVNDMKTPYFTIEVKDGKLIQSHGYKDSYPDKNMQAFLSEYIANVLNKIKVNISEEAA